MIRPKRIKRPKMGVREVAKVFMRHRAFVKRHGCAVPGCGRTDIVFAHIRNAANSGTGDKPHDAFGYGLCDPHHQEEHDGQETFWAKYGINPYKHAAWFVRMTTDVKLRQSFAELPEHVKRPILEAA